MTSRTTTLLLVCLAAGLPSPADAAPRTPKDFLTDLDSRGLADEAEPERAPGPKFAEFGIPPGAAAEVVQVLAQIVADRASAAALGEAKGRALKLLKCDQPSPALPQSCKVIAPLRIADLAVAPEALREALLADIHGMLVSLPALGEAGRFVTAAIQAASRAALRGPSARDASQAHALAQAIVSAGLAKAKATASRAISEIPSPGQRALALAALAVAECEVNAAAVPLARCDVLRHLDNFAMKADCAGMLPGAHALAAGIQEALGAGSTDGQWVAAIDAALLTAELLAAPATGATKECDPGDLTTAPTITPAVAAELRLVRQALVATVQRDVSGLLSAAGTALRARLEKAAAAAEATEVEEARKSAVEDSTSAARGLQLLAAAVQYSDTFTSTGGDAKQLHEQRVKILKSVVDELANREGREGETIFSVGGSLAATGGARFARGGNAISGPFALSLGFGLDYGLFHGELGFLDLGQYVSYDDHLDVVAPELVDALSLSLTLGRSWGSRTPFFLGATVGYTPHYRISEADRRGSLQAGVILGVYVPLLDFN